MAKSEGTGEALNATISSVDYPGGLNDEERAAADLQVLRDNIDRAKAKVYKLEDHLAAAKQAVEDAGAELAAAEGN